MRRILIFGLALSLAGLGQVPLSACSLLSSELAECATPQTQTQCDKMNMDVSGTHFIATPDRSCCFVKEPLPVSQYKATGLSLASVPVVAPDPLGAAPHVQDVHPTVLAQDISPPGLQSLLCTFLI